MRLAGALGAKVGQVPTPDFLGYHMPGEEHDGRPLWRASLLEAGLPPEVIQLVHGHGETAGAAIVNHPRVPVVSFTGSTETGRIVGETCTICAREEVTVDGGFVRAEGTRPDFVGHLQTSKGSRFAHHTDFP